MILLSRKFIGGFVLVLVVSLLTHVPNYDKPAELFWDENFHIASAQRYLNEIFFMEPHPPLGKLLIAAGEWMIDANDKDDQFISIEKAEDLPAGFSFAGYRLIPTICGALVAPALYVLIYVMTGSIGIATFVGLFPALDNALIVHNRSAMLDAPLLFCFLAGLLGFFCAFSASTEKRLKWYILFGVACGAALSIKVNGGVLCIFGLMLLIMQRRLVLWVCAFFTPALFIYFISWWLHFYIAHTVHPELQGQGLFDVSTRYAEIVQSGKSRRFESLALGIQEAFAYSNRYQAGVPQLDYCKEDETGSAPIVWPLGGRTINYRWEENDGLTRYLYLVPNPVTWSLGIIGVCGAILFSLTGRRGKQPFITGTFTILLLAVYFLAWLSPYLLPRVFYLYHYFIALIISWILFGTCIACVRKIQSKYIIAGGVCGIGFGFLWMSPLTYYQTLPQSDFDKRALLRLWDLRCPECPSYYQKFCEDNLQNRRRTNRAWVVTIGDLRANYIEQGLGEPKQEGDAIKVLARSKIQFPINKKFTSLDGRIEISSPHMGQNIEVQILADGKRVWGQSLREELRGTTFSVPIAEKSVLILLVKSEGEMNEPTLVEWRGLELR